jgi:hypothetical protein
MDLLLPPSQGPHAVRIFWMYTTKPEVVQEITGSVSRRYHAIRLRHQSRASTRALSKRPWVGKASRCSIGMHTSWKNNGKPSRVQWAPF